MNLKILTTLGCSGILLSKVGDLVSRDNIFLGSEKVLNAKLTLKSIFPLNGSGQCHT